MLSLKRGRGWSIYSLRGRKGPWASALHCAHAGGAGCPGVGPDVRGFPRRRMSGPKRRMSGLGGFASGQRRRISGLEAGCPGLRGRPDVRGLGPGCPGWLCTLLCSLDQGAGFPGWRPDVRGRPDVRARGPDVRGLGGELVPLGWFSSSVECAACPSSHASSGGPS